MRTIARSPWSACYHIGFLYIRRHVTWRKTIFHGKCIQEWFNRRTNLSATSRNHIIHEMCVIQTSHIGFHCTRFGIHAHKAGAQETLIVSDRVHWRHHRVDVTMIGENGHLNRTMKGCANLLLTCTLSFHITIALTLIHISIQNRTQLSQSQRRCKRSILLTSISLIKGWLQEFCHMTIY